MVRIRKKILELFNDNETIEIYGFYTGFRHYTIMRGAEDGSDLIVKDDIVKMEIAKDDVKEDGIRYVCGGPGFDSVRYYWFKDYGETWALTKEEIREGD